MTLPVSGYIEYSMKHMFASTTNDFCCLWHLVKHCNTFYVRIMNRQIGRKRCGYCNCRFIICYFNTSKINTEKKNSIQNDSGNANKY